MSTGEDEPCSSLNGRLRPRKSTTTTTTTITPSPQSKTIRKTEDKLTQDRPKQSSTPSKELPTTQNDLASKSDISPTPLYLCPYCDRTFNAKQTGSKHARRIHLSTSKQDNFIKCLYCNHSDAESNAIIKHMVDSHPNQYFACLDCQTRFPNTTELAEHKINVCEKQKLHCSKLQKKTSTRTKKNANKKLDTDKKSKNSNENTQYRDDGVFDGIVISCELKPSDMHDAVDIEDKITTNLIVPHSKTLGNIGREKNAVIVLDDLQWNKRIPPNFSFHNTDADQILSRLGVVHRSPRVRESRKDLIRLMDEPNEKFEKCFDSSFYTKVAKNVKDNLTKYLDGSFNFNSNREVTIKTRKSKSSVVINTAEGFPILLAHEQFSRNLFDGFIPRAMAPKHKWKWDTAENDKNIMMLLDQTKRDSHVSNCIVTLISSLDIWTQLQMKSKFEGIFKASRTVKKTEKQNIISLELKEILESRDIPTNSSQVVQYRGKLPDVREGSELPAYLGLSPIAKKCQLQPAVLSGEWVRPRCFVCCACGEQTRDARTLSTHLSSQHPNAQVQHYEIVGETLLSADIVKHLYVPPSQISNRTRPPRGFRDCTKCKKSITVEDLHQHMLDCAGDTPAVRRKCRYRPFGVRKRRSRLPDNTIRKKIRKDIRSRHRQKAHMRPRPRVRTEVGDAETIRKMIADLPAKRNRISPSNVLRPRRNIVKAKSKQSAKLRPSEDKKSKKSSTFKNLNKHKGTVVTKNQIDTDNDYSSTVDEDDQPLKLSASTKTDKRLAGGRKKSVEHVNSRSVSPNYDNCNVSYFYSADFNSIPDLSRSKSSNSIMPTEVIPSRVFQPVVVQPDISPSHPYFYHNQNAQYRLSFQKSQRYQFWLEEMHGVSLFQAQYNRTSMKQTHHGNMSSYVGNDYIMWQQAMRDRAWLEKAQFERFSSRQILGDCISPEIAQRDRISLEQTQYQRFLSEQAQHNRILAEQAQHVHNSLEQTQYNLTSFELAERNRLWWSAQHHHIIQQAQPYSFPAEQVWHNSYSLGNGSHNYPSFKQAQYHQMEMGKKQRRQMMTEQTQHNQQANEQFRHNQLMVKQPRQRVDVHAVESRHIRKHGNSNDNNMDGRKDHPVRDKDECNQSNNIAQVPNVPLKHSIASLTSHAERRDLSVPYYHAYLFPLKSDNTQIYETSDNRQGFENESLAEKLNKPPLSNDSIDLKDPNQRSDSPIIEPGQEQSSPDESVKSPELHSKYILPNDSLQVQEFGKNHHMAFNSIRSADLDSDSPFLQGDEKSYEPCKKPLSPNDSKELAETCTQPLLPNDAINHIQPGGQPHSPNSRKHPIPLDTYKLKIEASRKKFYKNRRGLKDSIAILKTKKSVGHAPSECGDDETQDSEIIDPETLDVEVPVSVDLDSTLRGNKDTKENNSINSMPLTHKLISQSTSAEQRQVESFSETKSLSDPSDDHNLTPRADNVYLRQEKTCIDSVYGTLNTKQYDAKPDLSPTKSSSRTECEEANQAVTQTEHSLRDNSITTRRNSDSRLLTVENRVVENPLYDQKGMETTKTSKHFDFASGTHDELEKIIEGKEDINQQLFQDSNQRTVTLKEFNISEPMLTIETAVNEESQVACDTKEIDNIKISVEQTNLSPASRRTRLKPTKKMSMSEQQRAFYYERNKPEIQSIHENTSVLPQHQSFYRNITESAKESNVHSVSSGYLVPATSVEDVPLKAPSDTQVRGVTHKQVLNSPESEAGILHNHDNDSKNKSYKKSLETCVENVNVQNLRRHSIELAQYKPDNYDIVTAQTYRERCEKAFIDTSPPSRGLSNSRQASQDFMKHRISENMTFDKLSERNPQYSPFSTFVPTTQQAHETMNSYPESISNDVLNNTTQTRTIQNDKIYYEDELFRKEIQRMSGQRQRSNNSESNIDYLMKKSELEYNFSGQERKTSLQTSNVSESRSHSLGIRRSSVDYHTRSSPFQCNVQNINVMNMPDRSLDMVSDENTNIHNNSLRAYHDSVACFVVPTVPYPNNMYNTMQPMQCEPDAENLTPLDLSCDSRMRKKPMLDSGHKSSEILRDPCDIQISNEIHFDGTSMNVNNRYNYADKPNVHQNSLLNREYSHESVSLEKSVKFSHAMSNPEDLIPNQINKHQTTPSTEIGQPVNLELSNNCSFESSKKMYVDETNNIASVVNASDTSSDRLSYLPPECNYYLPHQSQIRYPTTTTSVINRQESMQEKTFLENKKIARSSKRHQENKFEDEKIFTENNTALNKNAPFSDVITSNVENINQHEIKQHHAGHSANFLIESLKADEMRSSSNQIQEKTSDATTAQIYNQGVSSQSINTPIDQDAETARKFAMLPEELVKILGTIPKDHRNQLLNVLPQYVSNPVATVNNDTTNLAVAVSNKNDVSSQAQNKKHTIPSDDSNRLSVNTAISPSSIIPKKRHSPSQSRGSLSSNEIPSISSVSHTSPMQTLYRATSNERDDNLANNAQSSQISSCVQKIDSDNLALYPITEVVKYKSFGNIDDYTESNLVDLQNPESMNKNKDLTKTSGTAFLPPLPSQDLSQRTPAKNKHCNEQTASLRAVRIKTTSARKSFSDEKSLLTNYSFKTIMSTDDDYTNSGRLINTQSHSCKKLVDFNYANMKKDSQIQQEHKDDLLLQSSTVEKANNSYQDNSISATTSSITYNKLLRVNNEDYMCAPPNCAKLPQCDDKILFERSKSNQVKKPITLESPATVTLQNTNMDVDHFLGQGKATNFSNDANLSSIQINAFSSYGEEFPNRISVPQFRASDKNDFTPKSKPSFEDTENTNEINKEIVNQFFPSSNINEENDNILSNPTNDNISPLNINKTCAEKAFDNSLASSSECVIEANFLSETQSLIEEKSNEDDSEDDVSLAVIKQKHFCNLSLSDRNNPEVASEQIMHSAKLDIKERSHQFIVDELDSTYRIMETSKSIEIADEDNITEDDDPSSSLVIMNDVESNAELSFNEKETQLKQIAVINTDSGNIIVEDNNKNNNEVIEFDVNKENNVTENVNKIKEDDHILERNTTECQLENCVENTISNEYMDVTNVDISTEQRSGDNSIASTGNSQEETGEFTSYNFEILETDCSSEESHLKTKSKTNETLNVYNKSEIERFPPDVESNNGSDQLKCNAINSPNINEPSITSKHLEFNEFMEATHKNYRNSRDITSEFKKYSDVCESNTLSLRRSRRVKSLYVDDSCLDDNELIVQVEDEREDNMKTPLTMKRLILSRVERDRKRNSESIIFEKCSEAVNDLQLNDSNETTLSCMKTGKVTKRKKSPQLKRKSKKIKSSSANQRDEIIDDAVADRISTLQESPKAVSEMDDRNVSKRESTCSVNPGDIIGLSIVSTLSEHEKISEVAGGDSKEVEASNVPGKRKLNITKITDPVSSKSKKSKHHKKKSQSDFDSDDDKVLLQPKTIIAAEKYLTPDKESSTSSIGEKTDQKEDNEGKLYKSSEGPCHDMTKQSTSVSMVRITCYNRPLSNKKSRTSSASLKDHANYDPYDIDFEDMIDTSKPIIKKKSKIVGSIQTSKSNPDKKVNVKNKELNNSLIIPNQNQDEIISNLNNESDSDSSKSDVPLQKYVREKALETDTTNGNNEDNIKTFDNKKYEKGQVNALNQKSDITQETQVDNFVNSTNEEEKTSGTNKSKDVFSSKSKGKKSTKRIKKGNTGGSETSIKDHNNDTVNEVSQKRRIRYKKTRRMIAATNASDEVDQQLRSDKFMENFGFYSEKIPRKSNLLAAKKISETFHMISNESEDSSGCMDDSFQNSSHFETKKKLETRPAISQDKKKNNETNFEIDKKQSTESRDDVEKAFVENEPRAVIIMDETNLQSETDIKLVESEVRNLEKDVPSGFKEGIIANVAQNCNVDNDLNTCNIETIAHDAKSNFPVLHTEQGNHKIDANTDLIQKSTKNSKPNKTTGMKDKMYPDIEEIDMFEDKFDKIKRKRRSQAVAAKQVQHVVESNTSAKSRKQTEKKRSTKTTKKNNSSTQVLTKGALKGYDGIKMTISTQDLVIPPNVSPPRQQKKRKKINVKRRKVVSDSESSGSEFDNREKISLEKDIYEFKESEDTELFELRPSTVMDRFRSMHNKSKFKIKEKDKVNRDIEREKQKAKEKEKNTEPKEKQLVYVEREKTKDRRPKGPDEEIRQKKAISLDDGQFKEEIQKEIIDITKTLHLNEKSVKCNESINSKRALITLDDDTSTKKQICHDDEDNNKKVDDGAIAGTSGFVPDRMDESDYESEISSPGQFIFYASEDVNCVCPSDNDSDESDIEKGCGRLNCTYKNRNADKNAAIENIFKNNAVRCEKSDSKEPEKPLPDLDQLFDSLLETNPTVNSEILNSQIEVVSEHPELLNVTRAFNEDKNLITTSTVSHHDVSAPEKPDNSATSSKELCSTATFDNPISTKDKTENKKGTTYKNTSKNETEKSANDVMSDSDSIQIFTTESNPPKSNLGYSLVSEECTQVNFEDIIADEMVIKNDASKGLEVTVKTSDQLKYNSEDEFDVDKPESLNRQYMHLVLPADKASSCAQTEHKSDSDVEYGKESAITKYLKGLSPSDASKLEIYTMVSAQGTQTSQPNTIDEDDSSKNIDLSPSIKFNNRIVLRSRIRLQKYDIHEVSKKSIRSKSIQTDKNTSCVTARHDIETESEDETETDKSVVSKEHDSVKGSAFSNNCSINFSDEEIDLPLPKDRDSFATPASKSTSDKHSPRKSDEGISTSHDYSADAFDQASFDDTGVARQRARRKCTVGKQNVLVEHWSSESEFDGLPPRPNSADSVVASTGRKKKSKKKDHHSGGRKSSRHASKNESRASGRRRAASGGRSDDSDVCAGPSRAPPGPKIRARPAHHYWSSDGEETAGPQPQHGWIVGDSHKKLVTMLAHAKGRKRNSGDKHLLD